MFTLSSQVDILRRALWILPCDGRRLARRWDSSGRSAVVSCRDQSHVIQTQVLLALVGAIIILVVAESLARAFAIVGAAGLVRYRARIADPKDAGVLLMSLAIGLIMGTGVFLLALFACFFTIGRAVAARVARARRPHAVRSHGRDEERAARPPARRARAARARASGYELWGSSPTELRYEVSVPLNKRLGKLTKAIRESRPDNDGIVVDWRLKKPKVVQT